METRFSEGPWAIRTIDASIGTVEDANGDPIGQVFDLGYEDRMNGHVRRKANAKLFSAAPDLFEALRLCYDHCRLYYPEVEHNNVGEAVRAALRKATGGSNETNLSS